MKKLFGNMLILLISLNSYGQFSISFNDTIRPFGSGAYSLKNIIKDNNDYYISGVFNTTTGQYPFILKSDSYGHIMQKKLYTDTIYGFALYPFNSMTFNGKKIAFCGQYKNNKGTFGFITLVNKYSLDTLCTKVYDHPDTAIATQPNSGQFSELTAIKPTPDGGYILTGNYNKDCITGNLRSFLMKIDSVGNVEWRRTYTSYYTFFDIEVAPDSGYYVPSGYNGTNALQIVKFNKSGIYQWKVGVTTNNMAGYPIELSLFGNNYAIVGYKYLYDVANHLTAVSVSKVDLISKTIVWEKVYYIYKSFDCISLNQAMGVETLANGDIIISGTANNFGHDAVILKLNSNGDSLWCKSYDFEPDPYDCQLNDLIITDDGGFMGVGFWSDQSGPGWTAWMFKTDANGVVGWEESKPLAELFEAKVYPNPARDFVIIELPENRNQIASPKALNAELKLYNALGQLVLERQIAKGIKEIRIDLKELKQGIYFFEIVNDEVVVGNGKFVKE